MNFKLTLWKTIISVIIGIIIGLSIGWLETRSGWMFSFKVFLSFFVVSALIIYLIWSLFEKK